MFKSGNWDTIKDQRIKAKVLYTHADLDLNITDQIIYDVDTTVVIIEDDENRYVGVAQCGPRDDYNQKIGREIAAGRALKELKKHTENPNANPSDVWELDNTRLVIFGDIPVCLDNNEDLDRLMFGSRS